MWYRLYIQKTRKSDNLPAEFKNEVNILAVIANNCTAFKDEKTSYPLLVFFFGNNWGLNPRKTYFTLFWYVCFFSYLNIFVNQDNWSTNWTYQRKNELYHSKQILIWKFYLSDNYMLLHMLHLQFRSITPWHL